MKKIFGNLNHLLFSTTNVSNNNFEFYLLIYIILLLSIYSIFISICNIHTNNATELHKCYAKNYEVGECIANVTLPATTTTANVTTTAS